jgi:hypothetical protein
MRSEKKPLELTSASSSRRARSRSFPDAGQHHGVIAVGPRCAGAIVLESGFGFEFCEDGDVVVKLVADVVPEDDFEAFFMAQLEAFDAWLRRLPEVKSDGELNAYAKRALDRLAHAVALAAERAGVTGYSRADIYCRILYTFSAAIHLACDRLVSSGREGLQAELVKIRRDGLRTTKEVKAEQRYRGQWASHAASKGALGRQIAHRLRREPLIRLQPRSCRVSACLTPQRRPEVRFRRRPRARVARVRCSRGDPSSADPSLADPSSKQRCQRPRKRQCVVDLSDVAKGKRKRVQSEVWRG